MTLQSVWNHPVRLAELSRGPVALDLVAGEAQRGEIARLLNLPEIKRLEARLRLRPWLDGAELTGSLRAEIVQESGVSLELFDTVVEAPVEGQFLPAGSPNAPDPAAELDLDPEAPDPPDVLEGEVLDLAVLVVEQLALSIDPFPRKPGETFDYQSPEGDDSPFAVLKRLKENER